MDTEGGQRGNTRGMNTGEGRRKETRVESQGSGHSESRRHVVEMVISATFTISFPVSTFLFVPLFKKVTSSIFFFL